MRHSPRNGEIGAGDALVGRNSVSDDVRTGWSLGSAGQGGSKLPRSMNRRCFILSGSREPRSPERLRKPRGLASLSLGPVRGYAHPTLLRKYYDSYLSSGRKSGVACKGGVSVLANQADMAAFYRQPGGLAVRLPHQFCYSCRRASIGSSSAAFEAG